MQCENAYEIAWWKEGKKKIIGIPAVLVAQCASYFAALAARMASMSMGVTL